MLNNEVEKTEEFPYLYSTRIQNIQTLKDITFHWSPGINVFVGDNNDGKTTIMNKTLSLIIGFDYMTTEKRKQFIRRRTDIAVVTHVLSNGDTFRFTISKDNLAGVFKTMDGELEINDTKEVVELFKQVLGLITFADDPTNILNIIDKHKASFLVNANPKKNAKSLSVLYYDEECEKMLMYTAEKLKQVNIDLKETSRKRASKLYEKNQLNYIEPENLNNKKKSIESIEKEIDSLECLSCLSYLDKEIIPNIDDEKLSNLSKSIKALSTINEFSSLLNKEIVKLKDYSELEKETKILEKSLPIISFLNRDMIENKEEIIYNDNLLKYKEALSSSNIIERVERIESNLNRDLLKIKDLSQLEIIDKLSSIVPTLMLLNKDLYKEYDVNSLNDIYNDIIKVNKIGYSLINPLRKEIDISSVTNIINQLSVANNIGIFNLPDMIENKEEQIYNEIRKEYDSLEFECPLCGQLKCNHTHGGNENGTNN